LISKNQLTTDYLGKYQEKDGTPRVKLPIFEKMTTHEDFDKNWSQWTHSCQDWVVQALKLLGLKTALTQIEKAVLTTTVIASGASIGTTLSFLETSNTKTEKETSSLPWILLLSLHFG